MNSVSYSSAQKDRHMPEAQTVQRSSSNSETGTQRVTLPRVIVPGETNLEGANTQTLVIVAAKKNESNLFPL